MDDQTASPAPPEASAPEAPVTQEPVDIAKVKAEIRQEIDAAWQDRFAGLQTTVTKLTEENRELRSASMSDEERDEAATREQQDYIAQLERKVALGEFAQKHPELYPVYEKLLNAESAEEQIEILASLNRPAEGSPVPQPDTTDVNNPAPTVGEQLARMPDGTPIDGSTAWDILKRMGNLPLGQRRG